MMRNAMPFAMKGQCAWGAMDTGSLVPLVLIVGGPKAI